MPDCDVPPPLLDNVDQVNALLDQIEVLLGEVRDLAQTMKEQDQ